MLLRLFSASKFPSSLRPFYYHQMAAKSIAVLDEHELKDGQMKQVDFDKGKVLVARLGDKIHATSAYCTHYGAPLAKGVLTADARISLHGACFNLCNGDIEDAPAPSPIHSFKAYIADGKIHVTANPDFTLKENLARPPKLSTAGFDAVGKGTVIIGGGSGAFQAVESLREHGYKYPITVVSKEPHAPIDRTKLSKALITDASKLEWKTPADLKIKYGVNLRAGVTVTSVELQDRRVILDNGKDNIVYDKLVIAPGGIPRKLPIPGADLENVYTFRGVSDAQKIDGVALEGKKAVFIGSSFISMELVIVLSKRKLASIDVIGMEEYPFEVVLGKQVGAGLKKFHESQGVKFHMQNQVEKIVPREDNPSLAESVVVNGEALPADFVVMGVGVAPATEFLKGSGIELEKGGGIEVDECLRVTKLPANVEGVFAIGDVAIYPQAGELVRIEHWNVAGNHGRAVGKTIAGQPQPFVKTPVFWSAQGQQLRYCGYAAGHDEVIIKGDPGEMKFVAYYVKQGKIVAVASMQNDPVVSAASELLRLGLMPSPNEIKAGKDLLAVDVSSVSSLPKIA
ncbi:hypothetical protein DFJ43DRAFT_1102816 [Lentinula guzmanii]|uniref:Rieske domain-containing protein n=1 Tax=Lentinula guzmanii TaxID=2804957 RepID=A0AA38MVK1_9AGAR|nr:hypothetical protein DFJ43DRAFT_1102816 [Lentinula guzmanii]